MLIFAFCEATLFRDRKGSDIVDIYIDTGLRTGYCTYCVNGALVSAVFTKYHARAQVFFFWRVFFSF